jgi:extradiol dioxygenase family protein
MAPAFHLSLSVADLDRTEAFYTGALGARVGRRTRAWIDVWLFGAQVTVYARPGGVLPLPQRDTLHFGATLAWDDWEVLAGRLNAAEAMFRLSPTVDDARGQAKMMLVDPDGYLIEIKAYRDPEAALNRPL